MAILKFKDIKTMNNKTREDKFKELKMELVKANVAANKTNAKTKEIKKTIARLITYERILNKYDNKEELRTK